ncbi:MAG: VWA domain-containing protein [Candidatus Sulfopaludibacter sp.]|nr:VWA domain-containing protein [Candidatus Sulfopaludibacter sp.]
MVFRLANYALAAAMVCALPAAEAPKRVTLNVVAVDSKGNPIADLKGSDFRVTDSGKPQQIDAISHRDARLQPAVALGPDEVFNRAGSGAGPATVILFDLLNEHMDARGPAWNELLHALQPLESSTGLYLYLLTVDGRLYPVHGLPDNEKEAGSPDPSPWTRQIKTLLDEAMHAVFRVRPVDIDQFVDVRINLTYQNLRWLAARMAGIPGRKNIVWITHGIPIVLSPAVTGADWFDYTPYLRQLSEELDRANVSIYPVQQIPPGTAMPGTQEAQHSGLNSEETLQDFARYTGGLTNGSSDIRVAIRQAMNDVRTSYRISYYPTPQNWDGKFHKVRVTCARKGVRIQTKEGYYAWPEERLDERGQQQAVEQAVTAPFDATEIGLRATLTRDSANAHVAHLLVRVDPADVKLERKGDRYEGQLKIRMSAVPAVAGAAGTPVIVAGLRYTPAQYDGILKNGIRFSNDVNLVDGLERLRVVVLDTASDAVGSVTMPVR